MQLRPYQSDLKTNIDQAWNDGARNVLAVLPTGGGKTVIFSNCIREHDGPAVAIAHRQELVSQISLSLAREKVRHRIIGPEKVVRLINKLHVEELGKSYFHPAAHTAVAGVDTLVRRGGQLAHWCKTVTKWVTDEAHHTLLENKWGTATLMFPNAVGLGVTATPVRADGRGLGRHADGVFDTLVEGPGMRELIDAGYLTDYRIFAPPSDLDLSSVKLSADGDYSKPGVKQAVRKSQVIGDVVKHYIRLAPGKLGITFASDVETATDIAAQFNAAGVPAEVVSAKTPDLERARVLRRFKAREILQLVNVDLFGEGFDLPAIEVVSFARPTQSFGLYAQQFGRALRILNGKTIALIIDHVGNVTRHGLPDAPRVWTLDRQDRKSRGAPDDVIPVKACPMCSAVYERIYSSCPYCDYKPLAAARSGPEHVDGDLEELDAATLAAMRGEAIDLLMSPAEYLAKSGAGRLPHVAAMSAAKQHTRRQDAQRGLRESIAWWAGHQRAAGRPDSESYRRFYFSFGIDVLSAQALPAKDTEILTVKINQVLTALAV